MDAERLKIIACNAILKWREDAMEVYDHPDDEKELIMCQLGITEEEYKEIMEVE